MKKVFKILIYIFLITLLWVIFLNTFGIRLFAIHDSLLESKIMTLLDTEHINLPEGEYNTRKTYIHKFNDDDYIIYQYYTGIPDDSSSSLKKTIILGVNNDGSFYIKSEKSKSNCSRGKVWFGPHAGWCK
ncbi:MAG: hypothetical protein V4576_02750 [Patescibacteria group bacterium]